MLDLIPAIDIKDGQCVRLFKGDFDQATVYGDDPASIARRWVEQGATRLHLVDLDGAKAGHPINTSTIAAIRAAVDVPLQLGGGLRGEAGVTTAFDNGINRVILGTVAVREPELVGRMVDRFGEQIIVSVDARDGWVATSGWTTTEQVRASDMIVQMAARGVTRIIYTDIARDGTLTSPNYDALAELVQPDGPAIIASGGIAKIEHLQRLADLGVEGAIIGKAMYTGAIVLPEAIAALS